MRGYGGGGRTGNWVRALGFLLAVVAALNAAGWLLDLFAGIPPYDELVHFLTPFTLVAIASTIIYRSGGRDEFFSSTRRALLTGAVLGLLGAVGWELFEVLLVRMVAGISFRTPPVDTLVDIVLGIVGGTAGARMADWRLDRRRQRM